MATVVSRTFRSTPYRDAVKTWEAIVDLLINGKESSNKLELLSVTGVAASIIADQYPKDAPIVITCEGPRTRIYCTFDDKALDGTDENEDALGFNPLNGNWSISLPCHADDLSWVQTSLKKHTSKITARDMHDDDVVVSRSKSNNSQVLSIDPKEFLKL